MPLSWLSRLAKFHIHTCKFTKTQIDRIYKRVISTIFTEQKCSSNDLVVLFPCLYWVCLFCFYSIWFSQLLLMHKMLFCVLNNHFLFFVYIIYDFLILCIVNLSIKFEEKKASSHLLRHRSVHTGPYAHISLVFLHPQVQLQYVLGRL